MSNCSELPLQILMNDLFLEQSEFIIYSNFIKTENSHSSKKYLHHFNIIKNINITRYVYVFLRFEFMSVNVANVSIKMYRLQLEK